METPEFLVISMPRITKKHRKQLSAARGSRPKPAPAQSSSLMSKVKGLLSKQEPKEPPPSKMHLGNSGGAKYDPVSKRWLFAGEEDKQAEADEVPPPPAAFTCLDNQHRGQRYLDSFGSQSATESGYVPANCEEADPEESREKNGSSHSCELLEDGVSSSQIEEIESQSHENELRECKFKELQYAEDLETLKTENEELFCTVAELNKAKADEQLQQEKLKWDLTVQLQDKAHLNQQVLDMQEALFRAEKDSLTARTATGAAVSETDICQTQLRLAQTENAKLLMENKVSFKDLEIEEFKRKLAETQAARESLAKYLERVQHEKALNSQYFKEERARLQQFISELREESKRLKEGYRTATEDLEQLRSDIEEKDIKVEYLLQAKSRTDFELNSAVADRKHAEEDLEHTLQHSKTLDLSRRQLEEEIHSLKMVQASEHTEEPLFDLQAQLEQAETQKIHYQTTFIEEKMKNHSLNEALQKAKIELEHKAATTSSLAAEQLRMRREHKEQVAALNAQSLEHEQNLSLHQEKIKSLKNSKKHLKQSALSLKKSYEEALEDLESRVTQLNNQNAGLHLSLRGAHSNHEQENEKTQGELSQIKSELASSEAQLSNSRTLIERTETLYKHSMATLQDTITEMGTNSKNMQETFELSLQNSNQHIEELKLTFEQQQSVRTEYEGKINELQCHLSDLTSSLQESRSELEELQAENRGLTAEYEAQKLADQEEALRELGLLTAEYEAQKLVDQEKSLRELEHLNSVIAAKDSETNELRIQLCEKNNEITHLQSFVFNLENQATQTQRDSEENSYLATQTTENLENRLQLAIHAKEQFSQELAELHTQTDSTASEEIARLNSALSLSQRTIQSLNIQTGKDQEDITDLEQTVQNYRDSTQQKDQRLTVANMKIAELQEIASAVIEPSSNSGATEELKLRLSSEIAELQYELAQQYEKSLVDSQQLQIEKEQLRNEYEKQVSELRKQLALLKEESAVIREEYQRLVSKYAEESPESEMQEIPLETEEGGGWFTSIMGSIFLTDKERGTTNK